MPDVLPVHALPAIGICRREPVPGSVPCNQADSGKRFWACEADLDANAPLPDDKLPVGNFLAISPDREIASHYPPDCREGADFFALSA